MGENTFRGKTPKELGIILNVLDELRDTVEMTEAEDAAVRVAMECVAQVMNRLLNGEAVS